MRESYIDLAEQYDTDSDETDSDKSIDDCSDESYLEREGSLESKKTMVLYLFDLHTFDLIFAKTFNDRFQTVTAITCHVEIYLIHNYVEVCACMDGLNVMKQQIRCRIRNRYTYNNQWLHQLLCLKYAMI